MARVVAGEVAVGGRFENIVGMGHGHSEGGLMSTKVGSGLLDDGLLEVGQVVLEKTWGGESAIVQLVLRGMQLTCPLVHR